MDQSNYLKDIQDIRTLMNRSSRFLSLSGLSGVMAGVYSIIGALMAYKVIYFDTSNVPGLKNYIISYTSVNKLIVIAVSVIILSLITGIVLSVRKAKKENIKAWDSSSKRLVINFAIPLFTGGVFIIALMEREILGLVAPATLIFYGLACINASKYTLGDIRYLGITLVLLGLVSSFFIGYGLFFWVLGFGVCHIVYGSLMYFKYDR